ncbi:hypothetical protein HNQ88_005177 [Aureibacter tunicatorum]|uniref:Uncharacterized protein n=1 Tax=Aureibacter tunicatorum TaxID=866807 RepID=A0AAE3XTD1_9BACT|nr:hypothetical protein [Aureibacter tunicatorum]
MKVGVDRWFLKTQKCENRRLSVIFNYNLISSFSIFIDLAVGFVYDFISIKVLLKKTFNAYVLIVFSTNARNHFFEKNGKN